MKPLMKARRRRRRVMVRTGVMLLGPFVLAGLGCSSGNGDSEIAPIAAIPEVEALSAEPAGVWGAGRATLVHHVTGGDIAVATTSGLFVLEDATAPPRRIVAFARPTRVTAMSMIDESTITVAFDSPAVAQYDVTTGDETGRLELVADQQVLGLHPRTGGGVVVETSIGPLLWASNDDGWASALVDAPTGNGDVAEGEKYVAPVSGTNEIAVVDDSTSDRIPVATPENEILLEARASPSGDVVAVTAVEAAMQSNPFDRQERVVLFDSTTWAPIGSIDTGTALTSEMWAVTDSTVVVGRGDTVSSWAFDGDPLFTGSASGVDSAIWKVVTAADGVLSIHDDGTIVHWSASSGASRTIAVGEASVESVVVWDEAQQLTVVDFFGRITTFDLTTGRTTIEDRFGAGSATGMAVSGPADQIAVSFDSGGVIVLDDDLSEQARFSAADRAELIGDVSFDPAGDSLVTALADRIGDRSFDDSVTIWDGVDGIPRFSVGGESEDVAGCSAFSARISFAPDGSTMAVASHDFTVSIVDVAAGVVERQLATDSGTVLDLAFTPDGRYLVSTTEGAAIRVWRTSDLTVAADSTAPLGGYRAIAMLPDGRTMAAADLAGVVSVVDVMTGEVRRTFAEPAGRTSSIVASDDGALVAAGGPDTTVSVWSATSGRRLADLHGATGAVIDLGFRAGGGHLFAASDDGTVRRWALDRQI